ncbi:MAG TPA: hypothetical protein ENL46_08015 [Candidatus Aminicenantes bacterium]|nr:hypothetical protein [Candidatus Aminicenantes bacterium]
MKRLRIIFVIALASFFMMSCSESTISDLLNNELNGPSDYYEMMDGYWVTIGGSLNSPAQDLYAELISVAGMLDEFLEMPSGMLKTAAGSISIPMTPW